MAEVFDGLPGSEPAVKRGRGGKKADICSHFLRLAKNIESSDASGATAGAENRGERTERGRLAGAIRSQQAVHATGLAAKTHVVHGANQAALRIVEFFAQPLRFDHGAGVRPVILRGV